MKSANTNKASKRGGDRGGAAKAYMVNSLKTDITVSVMGKEVDLPVKDIADGCVGVSLWFDSIDSAKDWGQDGDVISAATYQKRPTNHKAKETQL